VFAKQFVERGMDRSGIRLIGPGHLTDDDELPGMTAPCSASSPRTTTRH
jgi:branched-chain amino acid transport system substrate-binding protein